MHADRPFRIDLRAAAISPEPIQCSADGGFFESFNDSEILGGQVEVSIKVSGPRAGVYKIDYHVTGQVTTPCDRCNGEATMEVDAEDTKLVTSYDSDVEPSEDAPLAERGEFYDLGHEVFETVALARPLGFTHNEGECDQEVTGFISGISED